MPNRPMTALKNAEDHNPNWNPALARSRVNAQNLAASNAIFTAKINALRNELLAVKGRAENYRRAYCEERIRREQMQRDMNRAGVFWQDVRQHDSHVRLFFEYMLEQSVKELGELKRIYTPSIDEIIGLVAGYFGLSKIEIISQRRTQVLYVPRQIVMFLAREVTTLSYEQIGKLLGNRDHSTIQHGFKKIEGLLLGGDHDTTQIVNHLRNQIDNLCTYVTGEG